MRNRVAKWRMWMVVVMTWCASIVVAAQEPAANSVMMVGTADVGKTTDAIGVGAEPPTPAQLAKWVTALRSPRLADREAASSSILACGPAILTRLPDPATARDPEQRERLRRIVARLQETASDGADPANDVVGTNGAASRGGVSLTGRWAVSEVLREISTQCGSEVVDDPLAGDDPQIEVNFDRTPFWDAVARVAAVANRTIVPGTRREVEMRIAGTGGEPTTGNVEDATTEPVSVDGVFRTSLRRIRIQREFGGTGGDGSAELRMAIEVFPEPSVRMVRLGGDTSQMTVEPDTGELGDGSWNGDGGRTLRVRRPGAFQRSIADGSPAVEFELVCDAPPRDVPRLLAVYGTYTVVQCGEPVAMSVPMAGTGAMASAGGVEMRRIAVRRLTDRDVIVSIRIAWSRSPAMPESFEIQAIPLVWGVTLADGTLLTPVRCQITQSGPAAVRVELTFCEPGEGGGSGDGGRRRIDKDGVVVSATVPDGFRTVEVPFRFENVPLP